MNTAERLPITREGDEANTLALASRIRGSADRLERAIARRDLADANMALVVLTELVGAMGAQRTAAANPTATTIALGEGLTPSDLARALAFSGLRMDATPDGFIVSALHGVGIHARAS